MKTTIGNNSVSNYSLALEWYSYAFTLTFKKVFLKETFNFAIRRLQQKLNFLKSFNLIFLVKLKSVDQLFFSFMSYSHTHTHTLTRQSRKWKTHLRENPSVAWKTWFVWFTTVASNHLGSISPTFQAQLLRQQSCAS